MERYGGFFGVLPGMHVDGYGDFGKIFVDAAVLGFGLVVPAPSAVFGDAKGGMVENDGEVAVGF